MFNTSQNINDENTPRQSLNHSKSKILHNDSITSPLKRHLFKYQSHPDSHKLTKLHPNVTNKKKFYSQKTYHYSSLNAPFYMSSSIISPSLCDDDSSVPSDITLSCESVVNHDENTDTNANDVHNAMVYQHKRRSDCFSPSLFQESNSVCKGDSVVSTTPADSSTLQPQICLASSTVCSSSYLQKPRLSRRSTRNSLSAYSSNISQVTNLIKVEP